MLKSGYVRLSSPWLLSAVPALAYTIAYLDRLGEAYAHRIPVDWISISLTDALSRTAGVVLVLGMIIGSTRVDSRWSRRLPIWMRRAAVKLFDQVGPAFLFGFVLGSPRLILVFVGVSILMALFTAIRDFGRRGSLAEAADRPRQGGIVVLERSEPGDIGDVQVRAVLVVATVAIALALAMLTGWSRAAMQQTALVSGRTIVAASYGGSAVLADYKALPNGSWQVGSVRQLVRLESSRRTFVLREAPSTIHWR